MIALLLAAAAPDAVAAERAFAAAAQTEGQWTAFRAFAAPDATMFAPQPVEVQAFLAARKDPPLAVQWVPAASYVACDGSQAVNTGPWYNPAYRGDGYFTTVWRRDAAGWRWIVDGGDRLQSRRAAGDAPRVVRASCRGKPVDVPAARWADGHTGEGLTGDRTLRWRWHVAPDGARQFDAWLWDGRTMAHVVADRIAAPAAH